MSDIRIKVSYNIFTRVPGFEKNGIYENLS